MPFNDRSRIVLMSDAHRGNGTWADDFLRNQHLTFHALREYHAQGFTYIELGDGDELWENKLLSEIAEVHGDVYSLLQQFHKEGRLHMLFGNHDMLKKDFPIKCTFTKIGPREIAGPDCKPLKHGAKSGDKSIFFEKLTIPEGLILVHEETGGTLFLTHGHQGDPIDDQFWKTGRFLVRHLWRSMELLGAVTPTSAAKNNKKKNRIEAHLAHWAKKHGQILICGHTHKPTMPSPHSDSLYFNTGSCVHPKCITAIEIANGNISLVKWLTKTKPDGSLFVTKEFIAGPVRVSRYFK